jgi:hypothetical protein
MSVFLRGSPLSDLQHEPTVLDYRVNLVEQAVKDISTALTGIRETLQTLAMLEVRHTETRENMARMRAVVDDVERRTTSIEMGMPVLHLTSKWVIGGVISIVGMVGIGLIRLIMVT